MSGNFNREDIDFHWSEIEIKSRNYNSENSKASKYSGKLKFIFGDLGIIYNKKIEFDNLEIDLETTASWFESKKNIYNLREKLFFKLNLKQQPRPRRNSNNIKRLNEEEIKKVNDFINNKEYCSTIKELNALFSGNNPKGERKNPKASPLFGVHKGKDYNIATFFKFYYLDFNSIFFPKNGGPTSNDHHTNDDFINAIYRIRPKTDFEDYIEKYLPKDSKESFSEFQNPSSQEAWKLAQKNLKENLKNNKDIAREVDSWVIKARAKFSKEACFEVFPVNELETEKAHIIPVFYLRRKMIDSKMKKDNEKFNSYFNDISNKDNYLNLVNSIHRLFDKKIFTYSEKNGKIKILDEKFKDKIDELNKMYKEKFLKIPEKFLTNGRLSYLKKRQYLLNEEKI